MPQKREFVPVNVRFHPFPWKLIRQEALDEGISASEWLRRLVDEYFTLKGALTPGDLESLNERANQAAGR